MNVNEAMDLVQKHVNEYVEKNKSSLPSHIQMDNKNLDHVKEIACSIMRTKWKVGYPGGSFVQAVVANNLMEAMGRADVLNRESLYFYCMVIKNLDMPMKVYRFISKEEVD